MFASCTLRLTITLVATAFMVGCAALAPQPAEQAVTARANARWAALLKPDPRTAYSFMTPAYRATYDEEAYRKRRGNAVKWTGAEVAEVRCPETTKCIAKVRIDAKPFMGRKFGDTITVYAEETWLLEGGQWWLFEKL